jgi:hypothetical protein
MTDATNPVETSLNIQPRSLTTYALVYINEVLHYQFFHRKISTLTFETHHVEVSQTAFRVESVDRLQVWKVNKFVQF